MFNLHPLMNRNISYFLEKEVQRFIVAQEMLSLHFLQGETIEKERVLRARNEPVLLHLLRAEISETVRPLQYSIQRWYYYPGITYWTISHIPDF